MQSIEQASNAELLSALTGSRPAQLLMERFGGLAPLARASLDDLQQLNLKTASWSPQNLRVHFNRK